VNQATIRIKKYANRRMYDTSASRYVNLDELAAMVRNGKDVQIVDAKTGEDLTRVTLTQIIVENAKDQPTGLPLELLRQLVVASDQAGQEFLMWYLKSAFENYQTLKNTVRGGLSNIQSAALSPVQMVKSFIQGAAPGAAAIEGPAEESELEQLRRRVAEMEARARKPARKKPKRKPKA
jgi:polyhydroxyalkanoate synthesis repressor PhaR